MKRLIEKIKEFFNKKTLRKNWLIFVFVFGVLFILINAWLLSLRWFSQAGLIERLPFFASPAPAPQTSGSDSDSVCKVAPLSPFCLSKTIIDGRVDKIDLLKKIIILNADTIIFLANQENLEESRKINEIKNIKIYKTTKLNIIKSKSGGEALAEFILEDLEVGDPLSVIINEDLRASPSTVDLVAESVRLVRP